MNGGQAPAGALGGPTPCNGVVKKWLGEKGFGFLVPEGGGEDIFVHRRALVGVYELTEGDSVIFQAEFEEKTGKWKAHTCSLPGGGGDSGAPPGGDGGRGKGGKGGKKGGGKGGRGGKGGEGMDMQWEMAMDTLGGAMGTLQPGGKKGGAKGGNKGGKGGRGGFVDKGVYGGPGDLGMAMGMQGGGASMGMPGGMPQQGGRGKGGKNNGGGKGGGQFGQMDQMGGFGNPNGGNPALMEQQVRWLAQQQAQHEAELDQRGVEPQMQVVAQLPMNWVQLRGPDGTFFVNSSTRQVTQDVPMELRQLAAQQQQQDQGMPPQHQMQQQMPPQQYGQGHGQAPSPAMQQAAPQQGVTTVKASVGDWLVCEDDQGTFYRDQRTGETYDEAPPELIRLAQQTQQQQQQQQQPQPRMDEQMYHQQQQQVHQMPYAGAGGFGGDPYGGRPPFEHQSM